VTSDPRRGIEGPNVAVGRGRGLQRVETLSKNRGMGFTKLKRSGSGGKNGWRLDQQNEHTRLGFSVGESVTLDRRRVAWK